MADTLDQCSDLFPPVGFPWRECDDANPVAVAIEAREVDRHGGRSVGTGRRCGVLLDRYLPAERLHGSILDVFELHSRVEATRSPFDELDPVFALPHAVATRRGVPVHAREVVVSSLYRSTLYHVSTRARILFLFARNYERKSLCAFFAKNPR